MPLWATGPLTLPRCVWLTTEEGGLSLPIWTLLAWLSLTRCRGVQLKKDKGRSNCPPHSPHSQLHCQARVNNAMSRSLPYPASDFLYSPCFTAHETSFQNHSCRHRCVLLKYSWCTTTTGTESRTSPVAWETLCAFPLLCTDRLTHPFAS